MSNNTRCAWIDVTKGIGIVLMVLAHTQFVGTWGARWINSFHMPLFFIMAGVCYEENRYPKYFDYFKRKCSALLYPYVLLSLFVIALLSVLYLGDAPAFSTYSLLRNMCRGATIGAFWFIWVLFVVELFYAIISKCLYHMYERLLLCAICGIVAISLAGKHLPFFLDIVLLGMPFYGIGHSLRLLILSPQRITIVVFMVLGVVQLTILKFAFPYTVGFAANDLHIPVLFVVLAVTGTCFVSGLSMFIEQMSKYKVWKHIERLFVLGKNSIVLLATHSALGVCRGSWVTSYPQLGSFWSRLIEFVLLVFLLFLLSGPMSWLIRMPTNARKCLRRN